MTKIKKIGVLSLAKIQAITMGFFGLLAGLFFGTIGTFVGALSDVKGAGAGFGLLSIIILPILYGVMGFIAGAIGGFIYNIAASIVGGIEVEFDQE